ncbi:retrotransposon-related protein [Senna tora]|uniref:Retrotransposon-related protein n=1 Tax=Senna tora TaxID=362788 RepID=A0A835CIF6_9FABA|nr:retrotransposon-related protein [Senna tora]
MLSSRHLTGLEANSPNPAPVYSASSPVRPSSLSELLSRRWFGPPELVFDELKQCMMSALVLAMRNFLKQFHVETDASSLQQLAYIEAVLSQNRHIIAFFSKQLSPRLKGSFGLCS